MLRLNLPQKSSSQPIWNPALKATALVSGAPDLCSPAHEQLAGRLLHLRVERAAGDAELGARFHDAHAGGPHVRIHALRLGNQLVEHGSLKLRHHSCICSLRGTSRVGGQRLERAARPAGEPGHLRPLEVGPHRRAGAEQQRRCCQAHRPHSRSLYTHGQLTASACRRFAWQRRSCQDWSRPTT